MTQRWLNSRELEAVLLMLEKVGMEQFGFDKRTAREVALSSVTEAKANFDDAVNAGSPDAGHKG